MSETQETKTASSDVAVYSGYFNFQNNLPLGITSGWAEHWNGDYGKETIDLAGLEIGKVTASVSFKTSSSNKDHWNFSALTTDGSTYSYGDKDCGFEPEDAGGTVMLSATMDGSPDGGRWFNVGMPHSSSCRGFLSFSGPGADSKD